MTHKLSCPVPKEQRPINEYMKLVQSDFFNWPLLSQINFKIKIIRIFFVLFTILLPFSNIFFDFTKSYQKFFLINCIFSLFLVILFIIRLFLSWNYIQQRLNDSIVFYEESSWYDGRVWTKSKSILFQERLIHMYQVLPIIKKITNILIETFLLFLSFLILLNF